MLRKIDSVCKLFSPTLVNGAAVLFFFLTSPVSSTSQTTNISGVINTYHSVTEIFPTKAGVRVDNTSGLSHGDLVVLIQMKGGSIVTANTINFGDTTSLNNAGNYEIGTICEVLSDTVFFFHTLLNNYTVADKVQLVKFGEYYSANVIDTVKAASWNNTTGKGGVLAIRAEEDITLNAPLFADSTGYKGGSFYLHSSSCGFFNPVGNGYAYDATSATELNGAYKGEGVADVPSNLDGARGAPANGGGGGNNHNNGGAGGANLTGGGNGGGNYSTSPIGCTGNYRGFGGKALSSWGGTKMFLGGGGGAGHANSTTQPYAGGNGGGIIIVIAKNIIGNSHKITANGQAGRATSYDGASGGGAGGSIIMNVFTGYSGSLTIQANGGNGGNEDDDLINNRCFGAGGGGSGGVIYFNGSVPAVTTSVAGGTAGINIDPTGCGAPAPASAGTIGSIISTYAYRASTDSSNYCQLLLPVRLISFNATITADKKIQLSWNTANPQDAKTFTVQRLNALNDWQTIETVYADNNNRLYQASDAAPKSGENIYRLKMIGKDNSISYSVQKRILINTNSSFAIYPNPAKTKIFVVGKFNRATSLLLTDLSGKLILQRTISSNNSFHQITLPDLPTGIYLLRIDTIVEKLMIR